MTGNKVLQKGFWNQRSWLVCHPDPIKSLLTECHLNRLPMKKFKTTLVRDCATRIAMGKQAEKSQIPMQMTKRTSALMSSPWGHHFSETLSCTK